MDSVLARNLPLFDESGFSAFITTSFVAEGIVFEHFALLIIFDLAAHLLCFFPGILDVGLFL